MPDLYTPLPAHETIRAIGGSDIQRIYKGDWHQLWLEKTGRCAPEDLTWKLPVQIGRALEPVILDFYGHQEKRAVATGTLMREHMPGRRGFSMPDGRYTFIHKSVDWAIGSFDGISVAQDSDGTTARLVEAKTTNYWNATKEVSRFIESYAPQQQWYMEVGGFGKLDFAFLVDNQRLQVVTLSYDEQFASILLAEAEEFWHHVINDIEPRIGRPQPKAPQPRVVRTKLYDMATGKEGNAWADAAGRWVTNRWAAAAFTQAATDLKSLMPEDAKKCFGAGITATRDAAGRVTFTADSDKE
ncbi:YqaJ viral recombinase family protein [Azospirillum sp. sgz301742]